MTSEFKNYLGDDLSKTKLGYYIDTLSRIEKNTFNAEFNKIGITFPQFRILNWLWRYEELTQKEIHDFVQIRPSSLTTILGVLIKNGFVKRKQDSNDGRVRKIILTEKSRKIENEAWEIINGFDLKIKTILTEEEYQITVKALSKLHDLL